VTIQVSLEGQYTSRTRFKKCYFDKERITKESILTMYFDGQLSYLDKDKPASASNSKPHHQRNSTAETASPIPPSSPQVQHHSSTNSPNLALPIAPQRTSTPNPHKSPTVSNAAGDIHSMALKSAINNIGIPPCLDLN
jgi:hypothetical protein